MISQYIALDTETTGLNPVKDRVLEDAAYQNACENSDQET